MSSPPLAPVCVSEKKIDRGGSDICCSRAHSWIGEMLYLISNLYVLVLTVRHLQSKNESSAIRAISATSSAGLLHTGISHHIMTAGKETQRITGKMRESSS